MADITSETIDRILQLARPELVQIAGRQYSTFNLHPVTEPEPAELVIGTLTGLVDYVKKDFDDTLSGEGLVIHILSQDTVHLISPLFPPFEQRKVYVVVGNINPCKFRFGQYLDVEDFIIALQSQFVQDEITSEILKLVGNIKDENVKNFSDDGVTQAVTAKAGIAMVKEVPVPNPVILRPFRTFMEIDQPESPFVFRMRKGRGETPECALFESDGGLWKLKAIRGIRDYLKKELPDTVILA